MPMPVSPTTLTLNQAIESFIKNLERKRNFDLGRAAKAAFSQGKRGRPTTYGFKQQDHVASWLERPLQPPMPEAFAGAIGSAIDESIRKYAHDKPTLQKMYGEFATFLETHFHVHIELSWTDSGLLPLNREATVLQMLCDNRSISEIAERLYTTERSISRDMDTIFREGIEFMGGRVPIPGAKRVYGRIDFESTPHPILLMGNLMQVITLLESLRLRQQQQIVSDMPLDLAVAIWQQLSPYARRTIQQRIEKRIQDGDLDSSLEWYQQLECELIRKMDSAESAVSTFQTEPQMTAKNKFDQIEMIYKCCYFCNVEYRDDAGQHQRMEHVRIVLPGNDNAQFRKFGKDRKSGQYQSHNRPMYAGQGSDHDIEIEKYDPGTDITLRLDQIISLQKLDC